MFRSWLSLFRQSHWLVLLLSVALSVAALSTVTLLTSRVQSLLQAESAGLMAADAVLVNDRFIPQDALNEAKKQGLSTALTANFPALIQIDKASKSLSYQEESQKEYQDNPTLASAKAVSTSYPLRGTLRVRDKNGQTLTRAPSAGEAYVESALLTSLHLSLGDRIRVGDLSLELVGQILDEPDRGFSFSALAPRVMFSLEDIDKTGFDPSQSRMRYALLVAGSSPEKTLSWMSFMKSRLQTFERIESANEGRSDSRRVLEQAESFLSLVALCAGVLAFFAVILTVRLQLAIREKTWAIYRTLGASTRQLVRGVVADFGRVFVLAVFLGTLSGWLLERVLVQMLLPVFGVELPSPSWAALLAPILLAFSLMLPVFIVVIKKLLNSSLSLTLRGMSVFSWRDWLSGWMLLPVVLFVGLMWGVLGFSIKLSFLLLGFLITLFLFLGFFSVFLRLISWLSGRYFSGVWRWVGMVMVRRQMSVLLPLAAITVSLFLCWIVIFLQRDLVSEWQQTRPEKTPNRFAFNIQPDQLGDFQKTLEQLNTTVIDLDPILRGRITEINRKPIKVEDFEESARQSLSRELNLTYAAQLPEHNQLMAGRMWDNLEAQPLVSLEQAFADRLRLKIGDQLTLDIGGEMLSVEVASIRKVNWFSLRSNFFVIGNPVAFENLPKAFMATWRGQEQDGVISQLVQRLPNVTVIDAEQTMKKTQDMMQKMLLLVQSMTFLLIACAAMVLMASLLGMVDQKRKEVALLRTLGASTSFLRGAQRLEMSLVGGLAGLVSALFGYLAVVSIADQFFSFIPAFSPWMLGMSLLLALAIAYVAGWWALRGVYRLTSSNLLNRL
jgi:putative ABC transport system permease protein